MTIRRSKHLFMAQRRTHLPQEDHLKGGLYVINTHTFL